VARMVTMAEKFYFLGLGLFLTPFIFYLTFLYLEIL